MLDRLAGMDRGTLNEGKSAITGTPARQEDWTLNQTGNWAGYDVAENGAPVLNQTRTNNKANEITGLAEPEGQTQWVEPTYDARGNMITVPKPNSPASAFTCTWDAWDRLVQVKDKDTGQIVATYRYDGGRRRITKLLGPDPENPTTTYDYYLAGYQVLEVRKDEDTDPYEQYVWGLRYVHSPVCRWYDENADGEGVVQHYYCNDANFNVTALVEPDGDVVERVVYDPYGKATFYDSDWSNPSSTSAYANEVLYTGHKLDYESGLYYGGGRYYHPTLGLWTSRDRRYADGFNLYEYVRSSPADLFDPFGREAEVKWEEPNKPEEAQPGWVTQEELDKALTKEDKELGIHYGGIASKNLWVSYLGRSSILKNGCCYCWFDEKVEVTIAYSFSLLQDLRAPQNEKERARRKAVEAHERGHLEEDFAIPFRDKNLRKHLNDEVAAHDTLVEAYVLKAYIETHPLLGLRIRPILSQKKCADECGILLNWIANDKLGWMRSEMNDRANARDEADYRAAARKRKQEAEKKEP